MPVRTRGSGRTGGRSKPCSHLTSSRSSSLGRFTREELLERLFPVLTLHEFIIEDPGIQITGENTAVLELPLP